MLLCLCIDEVLCCLPIVVANSVALQGSLPRKLLILAEVLCLIPSKFGTPMESVLAVLCDCFSVQIRSSAGYFASFVFDQENALIV